MRNKYVLITPAKNEEKCIEDTIGSVISQTTLPEKWVIVSDNSTDNTDHIVRHYEEEYNFIKLLRVSENTDHNFSSKINAFNKGYSHVKDIPYCFIGNLDADVTFSPDYFENIISKFKNNTGLGIAGGIILELLNGRYVSQNTSLNSVAGAVQLFRRECYEDIGGYIPLRFGGVDAAAEILARKHGWKVQTFPDFEVFHHRQVSQRLGNILVTRFRQGITHYILGYHPVFQLLRCLKRLKDKPLIVGSLIVLSGYYWAFCKKYEYRLPDDAVRYLRGEQISRLKQELKHSR